MTLFRGVLILLMLAVTSACGGEATPSAVSDVVGSQPEHMSAPVPITREATPAALLDVVGGQPEPTSVPMVVSMCEATPTAVLDVAGSRPEPTSVPVAISSREVTPAALLDVVGGVHIRAESNLLFLTASALQQDVVRRIALINGVFQVDSYLEVDTEPNSIVGVSPGSPLRLRGELIGLASGEGLPPGEESAAIPGARVNANPYCSGMAGSMMAHRFQVGQTFELQGQRLRVIDLYRADRDELEVSIMLPLSTAQRLYDMEGIVTTVVVSVDPLQNLEQVQRAIQQVLEEDQ